MLTNTRTHGDQQQMSRRCLDQSDEGQTKDDDMIEEEHRVMMLEKMMMETEESNWYKSQSYIERIEMCDMELLMEKEWITQI